jgi:polyphosphate kinase
VDDRQLFINRELSWLEFNARVLDEARDTATPLLERLKFLAIFSSNLDEFFMIRVGGLKHRDPAEVSSSESGDRSTTGDILAASTKRAHELVALQYATLREVLPALEPEGIRLVRPSDVTGDDAKALATTFQRQILPVLTPMAIDPAHPFPHIQNRQLYLAAMLKTKAQGRLRAPKTFLAIVPVPAILPRFVPISTGFVILEDLIAENLESLFAGFARVEHTVFRLTRDQDFELSEQDSEDLLKQIQSELTKRKRGAEVRLEIRAGASDRLKQALVPQFDIEPEDVYEIDGPLNLAAFWAWHALPGHATLHDRPFTPHIPARVRNHKGDLFSLIRQSDLLLHHPYEAFDPVVQFIEQAAQDPDVLALKQTLYRAGRNSPIVAALARAAERDKQVTALIELKARFDEEANIEWARQLERAGAHVVYGVPGLKTHAKVTLVVRRDPDRIRRYVHLSTGNYNPGTARIYTDVGLMTCDDRLGDDAAALFNMMTGYAVPPKWERLVVAPHGMRDWVIERIDRETAHRAAGREARIVAKLNALVDADVIRALYRASRAGVPIDLIVRGICCLRPGLPGVSETIRVRSVVGKYLEHSRVLFFANGGTPEVYLTSADWMPRNFDRRVEIAFPVDDASLRRRLVDEVLAAAVLDDANARVLLADGRYERLKGTFDSQATFEELPLNERTFRLPAPPEAAKPAGAPAATQAS